MCFSTCVLKDCCNNIIGVTPVLSSQATIYLFYIGVLTYKNRYLFISRLCTYLDFLSFDFLFGVQHAGINLFYTSDPFWFVYISLPSSNYLQIHIPRLPIIDHNSYPKKMSPEFVRFESKTVTNILGHLYAFFNLTCENYLIKIPCIWYIVIYTNFISLVIRLWKTSRDMTSILVDISMYWLTCESCYFSIVGTVKFK